MLWTDRVRVEATVNITKLSLSQDLPQVHMVALNLIVLCKKNHHHNISRSCAAAASGAFTLNDRHWLKWVSQGCKRMAPWKHEAAKSARVQQHKSLSDLFMRYGWLTSWCGVVALILHYLSIVGHLCAHTHTTNTHTQQAHLDWLTLRSMCFRMHKSSMKLLGS